MGQAVELKHKIAPALGSQMPTRAQPAQVGIFTARPPALFSQPFCPIIQLSNYHPLPAIADAIIHWQTQHGRNHLPWQQTRDPYRVWLSEIMLQQTQVSTVMGYYDRFLSHFPTVQTLAAAPADQVMALWSGLGYYTRARNLHRCAQIVTQNHAGQFPASAQALAQLPGIGRSTAAAIASFCFGERAAILDANVKRVLTRILAYEKDLSITSHEKALWQIAEELLPTQNLQNNMPRYTQGLMDLGATICLPRKPSCILCPLQKPCRARAQGNPENYPIKTRKITKTTQSWWLLLLQNSQGHIWLAPRPPAPAKSASNSIWAGLYAPPIFADPSILRQTITLNYSTAVQLPPISHALTHRDLLLHPIIYPVTTEQENTIPHLLSNLPNHNGQWFAPEAWGQLGLPTPIRKLLAQIAHMANNPTP